MNILPLRNRSYLVHNAALERSRANLWIIRVPRLGWIMPAIPGVIYLLFGLLPLFIGLSICFTIPCLVFGLYFVSAHPLAAEARFDFKQREVTFTATYFLRFPRHIAWRAPLNEVTELTMPLRIRSRSAIHLTFQNGTKLLMEFDGRKNDGLSEFLQRLTAAHRPRLASESESNPD